MTFRSLPVLLFAGAMFLLLLEALGTATLHNPHVSTDFRQFYSAGILVRTEPRNLYSLARQKQIQDEYVSPQELGMPAVHPSYEAAFYSVFTLLRYPAAYRLFMVFNVSLLVVIAWVALSSGIWPGTPASLAAGIFLFLPVLIAVWHGQDSVLFLLLCCLCWTELRKGHDVRAGIVLALGLFRFHLAIPIAIFIAVRRGWRFLAAFAGAGAAIASACVAITGIAATKEMVRVMAAFTLSSDQSGATQHLLGIQPRAMPNVRGLLYGLGAERLPAHTAALLIGALSLGILGWCLYRSTRMRELDARLALGVTCSVLVAGHLYIHDATLLLVPMFLLRNRLPRLLISVLYVLPAVLFFWGWAKNFFLIALPVFGLLWFAAKNDGAQELSEQRV